MATDKNDYTCHVCKQLFKNPVVHRLCGLSFDRECIKEKCPAQQCGQVIDEKDLIVNCTLLKIVDEYRFTLESPSVHYLILLDTSTSMWYSDAWLPFALGTSRFTHAIQFLTTFFQSKMNSMTDKISLVTFDTAQLQRFDFAFVNDTHLTMLQDLKCVGNDSALFDSIDFCLDKLNQINTIFNGQMSQSYLFILTDGGNNFGRKESEHAIQISRRSGKLQISGHIIQIGDTNRKKTRQICTNLGYKYNFFKGENVTDFVASLTSSITTETQARSSRVRTTQTRESRTRARPVLDQTERIINQLPDVPDTSIVVRVPSKQKELA